jgi:hypothetical protein
MVFHIGLSVLHSAVQLLLHTAIFAPLTYLLFRRAIDPWFRPKDTAPV